MVHINSGHDGISARFLKRILETVTLPLTHIINQSLCIGIFPDSLKIAKVVPLFKKGDLHILDNYRPISLLPVVSKVFEKVVFNQLYQYVTNNNLIFTSQKRTLHSTELASLEVVDRVFQHLDKGKLPLSIFLDLSEAFDTLDHYILLNKLKFYGLSNTPLKWFESYLHGRKQYADFDGIHSNTAYISTGVPQGSILGPLLFIIYMNDIHMASQNFNVILYADDTNLISPLCSFNSSFHINKESIDHVSDQINTKLGNIQEWLNINKLSLNVKKTKFMIFHHYQQNINNIIPRLKMNSETIEKVSEFNFLGLTINEHLNWNFQIKSLEPWVLCVIWRTFYRGTSSDFIYNSLILPHLQYSILAWGFSMGRLDKLQKHTVRIFTPSKYYSHTDPLFRKLNLLKAKDFYELKVLKLFYKYKKNSLPFFLSNMFSDFTRSHG